MDKEEIGNHAIGIITGLSVVILCGMVVYGIAQVEANRMATHCDNLYGVDGWVMNETTGRGECKGYIGQCWHCINKSQAILS